MITTILTGAGAVLDWGAPSTSYLTEVLREDETFKTKSGVPIGEYLFCLLKGKNTELVNFEHIINLVESIYNYVYFQEAKLHTTNTVFTFINKEIERELFSFCDIYEKGKFGYFFPIVGDVEKCFDSKHQYMAKIYTHFIRLVIEKIEQYEQTIDFSQDLNDLFNKFLTSLNGNIIRFYTTNYDRIPAKINPGHFFEGFGRELKIKQKHTFLDTEKITSETSRNCYYNLHGSIHYNYGGAGWLLDLDKVFYQRELFQKEINQMGETQLPSNIITGMGKASRILLGPHLSFFNSFYNDCMRTDNLIIIGYSFSDVHINQAIKNAITSRHDDPVKILVIDYWENCEQYDKLWEKLSKLSMGFNKWDFNSYKINMANVNPHYIYGNGMKSFLEGDNYSQIFN